MTPSPSPADEHHLRCPHCQQGLPASAGVVRRVADEAARDGDGTSVSRVVLGHGRASSAMLFHGPAGPARAHVHHRHDETCFLVAGSGSVTIGSETTPIATGDVIVIPMGIPHSATFDEPFQMLSVYSPLEDPEQPDREWVDLPPTSD